MKKLYIPAALLLICLLTACGAEQTPVQEQPQASVQTKEAETPVRQETEQEAPAKEEEAPAEEKPTEEAPAEEADPMFLAAAALIDADVEELYDAVGYPIDVMYADSCLGEGEDGELYYDGFTVYTFRDAEDNETIYDVMEN